MNNIIRVGEGLTKLKHTEYLNNGEQIEVEIIDINLSAPLYSSKLSLNNIETNGIPGQVLMINAYGHAEWTTLPLVSDKELREKYPGLRISWERVMEALGEYEMVKKLVQDYD